MFGSVSDTLIVIAGFATSLWLGWYLWSDCELQQECERAITRPTNRTSNATGEQTGLPCRLEETFGCGDASRDTGRER